MPSLSALKVTKNRKTSRVELRRWRNYPAPNSQSDKWLRTKIPQNLKCLNNLMVKIFQCAKSQSKLGNHYLILTFPDYVTCSEFSLKKASSAAIYGDQ